MMTESTLSIGNLFISNINIYVFIFISYSNWSPYSETVVDLDIQ